MRKSTIVWSLSALLFLIQMDARSQVRASGRILSLPSKEPIAYVNIGIINSQVGTISNEDGTFSFTVPVRHLKDSIIFSALGYGQLRLSASSFSANSAVTIYLRETSTNLDEVVVKGESWRRKVYSDGNRKFQASNIYADTVTAGSAMALFVSNKREDGSLEYEYPVYPETAQVRIVNNTFDEFNVRVRLLGVDASGSPGKDLLDQSVVIPSRLENGWLKADLSKYKLAIEGDFYLVFEWILEANDRKDLFMQYDNFRKSNPDKVTIDNSIVDGKTIPFVNYNGNFYAGTSFGTSLLSASLKKEVSYYRLNSFGKWYRCSQILAASISLADQPTGISKDQPQRISKEPEGQNELLTYYRKEVPVSLDTTTGPKFFQSRAFEPILVEVRRNENQLGFFAKNHSQYPYQLTLEFTKIRNLSPLVGTESFTVPPGPKRLLVLGVTDRKETNYHYELALREAIGDPEASPDPDFPYLIPVRNPSILPNATSSERSDVFLRPANRKDTLFAMRKGIVTTVPSTAKKEDRIGHAGSLEIRHADGTVVVYDNLDPAQVWVTAGSTVLPGNPLGLLKAKANASVCHFQFSGDGQLTQLAIRYYVGEDKTVPYNEIPDNFNVVYPETMITRELSDQEKHPTLKTEPKEEIKNSKKMNLNKNIYSYS